MCSIPAGPAHTHYSLRRPKIWIPEPRGSGYEFICSMLIQLETLAKYWLDLPQTDPPWPPGNRRKNCEEWPDSPCKTASPPASLGTGQPELFTLGTDAGKKATEVSAWEAQGWKTLLTCLQFVPYHPPPPKMWIAPFTIARWQPPGATGLPPPCGRLTSHKQNKAYDCGHTSHPLGTSRGRLGY